MERSFRIGKDFNVRWSIHRVVDGEHQPYELAGKELVLQYRTPYGLKEATEWKVVGNTIVWTFRGKEQKALGSYELILTENGGKDGMVTVDTCRAFNLVAHSCEETEGSGSDIVIEDVVLESEVAFAPIVIEGGGGGSYDDTEIKEDIADLQTKDAEQAAKLAELSEEIYTEKEEKLPLNDGRYFNGMNVKVGNTFTAGDGTSASGVACRKFSVKAGEKYRLVGRYNYYAYKGYWITDANNVVTRMIADGESYDLELVIEGNESTLYVNCIGYNDEVDGVWKTTIVPIGDILEDVVSEVGELSEKVDNTGELEFSENTILDAEIVDGYAYNIGGKKVGEYFTSTPTQYAGYAYLRVLIDPSNTYAIRGVGSPYSFRYFAFLDKNLKILTIAAGQDYDTRNEPIVLTPPTDAAILIVNFMGYNAETDGVTCTENYSIKSIKDASQSEWGGKTIVTFGDSITQFEDANFMSWPQWLQHYTKANVINVGIGGTQLKVRATPSSSPTSDNQAYAGVDVCSLVEAATSQDFAIVSASAEYIQTNLSPINSVTDAVNRLQSIDWQKVDAAVIFAGTNDWYNGGSAIGTTGSQDEKTTLGAINKIIELINSTYPHVQLYWFTPIVRYIGAESAWNDANWGGNLEVSGNTLIEVVDLIKREVENNNIPICDLYRTLGWNKHNFKYYFNSGDGTHPNRGLRFIAQKVMSFMESNKTFL